VFQFLLSAEDEPDEDVCLMVTPLPTTAERSAIPECEIVVRVTTASMSTTSSQLSLNNSLLAIRHIGLGCE
jgi:hypothetical protein